MRILDDLSDSSILPPASVLTIGNFDGVHLAHAELIRQVAAAGRARAAVSAVVTFEPHPARVLRPAAAPMLLTPFDAKARLIERLSPDLLVVLPFTEELSRLSPADFAAQILSAKLHARAIFVGENFRFGRGQAGNVEILTTLGRTHGFEVQIVPLLKIRGERVSSSRIRALLTEGRVSRACRLLGRPYSIRGPIVRGHGVGRQETVPTLNLPAGDQLIPRPGVYISRARTPSTECNTVTNVGVRPTFGGGALSIETHLLDFAGQVSDEFLEVEFLRRLRDEIKFPSPAALKAQIGRDVERALKFFRLSR